MTIGEWAIVASILFTAWKPQIMDRIRPINKRVSKWLRRKFKSLTRIKWPTN